MIMSNIYFVYMDGRFEQHTLRELAEYLETEDYPRVWSARLSTGILGLTNCKPGNMGPKGPSEVLLAVGDDGLNKLVNMGFITCPVCHPEYEEGFWDKVKDTVRSKYDIGSLEGFLDRKSLPFDAGRLEWEKILPLIGKGPNRLYVPRDLRHEDLMLLGESFWASSVPFPPVGYYNPDVPERFTEYEIL